MPDQLTPQERPSGKDRQKEVEKTNRTAIEGWGPTVRIVFIRTVPAVVMVLLFLVARWLLFYG